MTDLRAPAADAQRDAGTPLGLTAVLTGTLVGTVSNNVVNVPLRAILVDFRAPLGAGVFVVVGFLLAMAAAMPLVGWIGDRFGLRRVYCVALLGTAACAVGAATAPSLPVLIGWRTLGGAAAAAFAPAAMGLIRWMFDAQRRATAIGAWASVNGIGQAIGPTMGGVFADAWGWRWVFAPLVPVALIGFAGVLRYVPAVPGQQIPFDLPGALALTFGTALLVLALGLISTPGFPRWPVVGTAIGAVSVLAWFVWHCVRVPDPFVEVRLVAESRFARSCLAAFAQMFCLGATLLAVPLYLTADGASGAVAGVVLFAVPATMAVLGPLVGRCLDRLRPRRVLRIGLVALAATQAAMAVMMSDHQRPLAALVVALVLTGVGIALVQTPAATGATRSPAGARGTGLGLFNLIRFTGSAMGAAWVGVALDVSSYPTVFVVTAMVVIVGLAGSFVGPDPERA